MSSESVEETVASEGRCDSGIGDVMDGFFQSAMPKMPSSETVGAETTEPLDLRIVLCADVGGWMSSIRTQRAYSAVLLLISSPLVSDEDEEGSEG